jgi:hypothetical protein
LAYAWESLGGKKQNELCKYRNEERAWDITKSYIVHSKLKMEEFWAMRRKEMGECGHGCTYKQDFQDWCQRFSIDKNEFLAALRKCMTAGRSARPGHKNNNVYLEGASNSGKSMMLERPLVECTTPALVFKLQSTHRSFGFFESLQQCKVRASQIRMMVLDEFSSDIVSNLGTKPYIRNNIALYPMSPCKKIDLDLQLYY